MKYLQLRNKLTMALVAICAIVGFVGCTETDDALGTEYGYVQFKLYKNETVPAKSASRSEEQLEYLRDAHKVKVTMQHDGSTMEQTLVLNAYNNEYAEYGLRSDKLKLMVGEYQVISYTLYDKLDEPILEQRVNSSFVIECNGLVQHNLSVNVTERGRASFRLVKPKNFVSATRAAEGAYPFSNIKSVSFTVKNLDTYETVDINKALVTFEEDFHDYPIYTDPKDTVKYNAQTTSFAVDTIVWLKAGRYTVTNCITYSDKKAHNVLDAFDVKDGVPFEICDNEFNDSVTITVQLNKAAEHIKDYIALKEIWLALDGPNWSYYGEAEVPGCNWDFNKDLDMWGEQPGVSIDGDGRVVALSLAGMGARGIVPEAIGQLNKVEVLSLGTHDELLGGHLFENAGSNMTNEQRQAIRMSYHDKFLKRDIREGLADILQDAINRDSAQRPITKNSRIELKDVQFGNLTNKITGISRAMMRLTDLQQFYIANSPIKTEGFFIDVDEDSPYYKEQSEWSWTDMKSLTDIEIYNCPELEALPLEILTSLPDLQSLNIACNSKITGAQLKSDWEAIIEGTSGHRLQLLYMGYNNLEEFPDHDHLSRMAKLALLDCTNNKIKTLHPFGKNINLTKVYLDYNEIDTIPGHYEEGDTLKYFFGYYDVELFSCTHNKLKEVPNIFNAKSINVMADIDFSYNQIKGFEDGDAHRGINATTVSLAYNQLEEMPAVLFKKGSPMITLNLAGNGMKRIPEGSMIGSYSHHLQTLDLSYNKLTKLPGKDFWATNLPYLYGIDLSYNSFKEFPVAPLDCAYLTTFGIRHQRDEDGNRTLSTWPTGLYTCPSLVAFYIGSNDLGKIEDRISYLIRYFEIKDNPNISIDLTEVCDYIAAGYYLLIYDKTQDIRGCSYLDLE